MELVVEPLDGPVDDAPRISVSGRPEAASINLTIDVVDAAGHAWRSVSVVENGTSPGQPWWSMEFVSRDVAPTAFTAPSDQLVYRLTATAGRETATADVVRRWRADGLTVTSVDGPGFKLTTFTPSVADAPSVLLVPGFTGVEGIAPQAALLASKGYRSGILVYADAPGLPESLRQVPIEALAAGYQAFAADRPTAVLTTSLGTAGVFSMLAAMPHIRPVAVIGIAATSVVWQALPAGGAPPKASMWTLGGEDLPWLPSHGELALAQVVKHATIDRLHRQPKTKALKLRAGYARGLTELASHPAAAIPVERIPCPLLLLSGAADEMWPSDTMAAAIMARRSRDDDQHIDFPEAGHFLRPPITPTTVPYNDNLWSGGTPAGIARAQSDGWSAIHTFLREHLA